MIPLMITGPHEGQKSSSAQASAWVALSCLTVNGFGFITACFLLRSTGGIWSSMATSGSPDVLPPVVSNQGATVAVGGRCGRV
jgi:hypothetical protein